ncbi:zinc-binding dehydrogenase [Nonomuraea angiospora]|uniref:NADPH:quinone reductase-like Zn-dependent oxidoreductase n=1 Tax=Nonomuraea angiospora TaxID=46172 RepID=A0ABR9MAP1_9ACTN|nr:zinc-binding dehydrogenase [Nonomuraea angiospora]MBE1589660.1 NADPH:quinone reductase-like Zn-dependent oxidoreductase [Nonomuraea angiospora]
MRALVVGPGAEGRFAEVPEPVPGPGQALVEVRQASVNFSDLRHMGRLPEGTVLGYDAAGVVLRAAEDGTGPREGARVAAFGAGAWAERAAFDTGSIAVVPDGVDLVRAAALPMAGLTALRSLRAAGPAPGSRVLVTGASGAVGRLAVQLAQRAGAHVIASVSRPERAARLAAGLGAAADVVAGRDGVEPVDVAVGRDGVERVDVMVGLDGVEPVDVVIETVGGPALVAAWALLRPGGNLQSVGWACGQPAVFPPNSTFSLGPARSLNSFGDVTAPADDLAHLLALVAAGEVSVEIGLNGSWEDLDAAKTAQLGGSLTGKIVLAVGRTP